MSDYINKVNTKLFTRDINAWDYSLSIFTDDSYLEAIDRLMSVINMIDKNRNHIKDVKRFNAIYNKAVEAKNVLESIKLK